MGIRLLLAFWLSMSAAYASGARCLPPANNQCEEFYIGEDWPGSMPAQTAVQAEESCQHGYLEAEDVEMEVHRPKHLNLLATVGLPQVEFVPDQKGVQGPLLTLESCLCEAEVAKVQDRCEASLEGGKGLNEAEDLEDVQTSRDSSGLKPGHRAEASPLKPWAGAGPELQQRLQQRWSATQDGADVEGQGGHCAPGRLQADLGEDVDGQGGHCAPGDKDGGAGCGSHLRGQRLPPCETTSSAAKGGGAGCGSQLRGQRLPPYEAAYPCLGRIC